MYTLKQKELLKRYREKGAESLEYKELLELLLAEYALEGSKACELIERLEISCGSLDKGLDMSTEELMRIEGMNKQAAVLLSMVPQLAARMEAESFGRRPRLESYEKMEQYARIKYYGITVETVYVFCLDKNWYLTGTGKVASGTIDQVSVYPREVAKQALKYNAARVIVTHNHPSGDAEPSLEDYAMTDRIMEALVGMDIRFEDHIIIAPNDAYSFAMDPTYSDGEEWNKDKGLGRSLARQREGHHGLDWEKIREELRKKEKEREEQEKKDK
jgi:UPF0758 protein LHK_01907